MLDTFGKGDEDGNDTLKLSIAVNPLTKHRTSVEQPPPRRVDLPYATTKKARCAPLALPSNSWWGLFG